MKEQRESERIEVTDKNRLEGNLSQKAEVRRRIRRARRFRFPWLLVVMILIIFLLIFLWVTYFSDSG